MSTKVSKDIKWILGHSLEEARRLKCPEVSTVLFLYSIIKFEIGIAFHVQFDMDEFIQSAEVRIKSFFGV